MIGWLRLAVGAVLLVCSASDELARSLLIKLQQFHFMNGVCTEMSTCLAFNGQCSSIVSQAMQHLSAMDPVRHIWSDVHYADKSTSTWRTIEHMERVIMMARAYHCPVAQQQRDRLLSASTAGLIWWLTHEPSNPNWWWTQMGGPQRIAVALILLYPRVSWSDLSSLSRAAGRAAAGGQNGLWARYLLICKAALSDDSAELKRLFGLTWSKVRPSSGGAGLQEDQVFYEHGRLMQNGAYGADYMLNILSLAWIANGTVLSMPLLTVISDFVLDGQAMMMVRGVWDLAVMGRVLARPGSLIVNIQPMLPAINMFAEGSYYRREDWKSFAAGIPPQGSRYYPSADYLVHHRTNFTVSVKMVSNRIRGTECVNQENLLGQHLSDGVTYFRSSGYEYVDLAPTWDWQALPGTTLPVRSLPPKQDCVIGYAGHNAYAGGVTKVTARRSLALAAMHYGMKDFSFSDHDQPVSPLTARKAWFMLDDAMIALGAEIDFSLTEEVRTTIEQCAAGAVKAFWREKGKYNLLDVSKGMQVPCKQLLVVHNEALVYLPYLTGGGADAHQQCLVSVRNISSNWQKINRMLPSMPVTKRIFKMQISHGKPRKDKYAYAVLARKERSKISLEHVVERFQSSVEVLSNTGTMQSIAYGRRQSYYLLAAVHQATNATVRLTGNLPLELKAFSTGVLIIAREVLRERLELSLASPDRIAARAFFLINRRVEKCSCKEQVKLCATAVQREEGWTELQATLPKSGGTVNVRCQLMN